MGNALAGAGRAGARSGARQLDALSSADIKAINKLVEQDQARMRHLPSLEELGAKDVSLDQLLNSLSSSVVRKDLGTEAQTDGVASASMSASASTSYRQPMPPARPVDALVLGPRKLRQSHAEEEPGRMPSYVIKDLFEQRNRLLLADFEKEMQHVVSVHRVDRAKLEQLFEYCALPDVGKVATFGHQYAFARAPAWYRRQQRQERFLSEPTEEVTKAEAGESVVTVVAEVQEALSTASSTDGSGSSSAQLRPAAAVLQAADAQA